jgi:cyclopropane fatty-acyl-phospholipid synthase-like methyltransferase
MVLAHHKDADLRLRIQTLDAQEHIIPFVEEWLPIGPSTTVLEVGCGEGGCSFSFS